MAKTITQKTQGNGQPSWVIEHKDEQGNHTQLPEIVYFDPSDTTQKTVKLTDHQLSKLMKLLGE